VDYSSSTNPGTMDLRPPGWAARDQGTRSTCMAFAATAAHELIHKSHGIALSEAALHWACKRVDRSRTDETTFVTAKAALGTQGQTAAADWPYADFLITAVPPETIEVAAWYTADLLSLPSNLEAIASTISAGYPVVLGVPLTPEFLRHRVPPSSPYLTPPPSWRPYKLHTVTAVAALIDPERGIAYVVARNSWGNKWGEQGFCRFTAEYVDSAVAETFSVRPADSLGASG
jgi:hypothetical protein